MVRRRPRGAPLPRVIFHAAGSLEPAPGARDQWAVLVTGLRGDLLPVVRHDFLPQAPAEMAGRGARAGLVGARYRRAVPGLGHGLSCLPAVPQQNAERAALPAA